MKTSISIAILLSIFLLISIGSSQPMNSSIGSVTMQITGNPGTNHHKETDVDVTKSFIATDSELKFKYDIKTPPVNDFDFVLALDSSGSMVTSRDSEQSNAVAIAVPDFIEKSSIKYKNIKHINMSIISWNDKIDFAYSSPSGFDNKDPSKAYPVGIKDVQKDLTNRHIFGLNNKSYKYYCNPSSHTNLSLAIKASLDILNNTNTTADVYRRPVRFIILVTGESEYDRCSDDLIAIARELGYSIYAIEMQASDVEDPGVMLQHLRDITGDTNQKPGAPNKAITCQAPTEQLPEALSMKLQEALNAAITEPVATNVTIYESFYDYIVPSDEAYVEILQIPNSYTKINTKTSNNIVSINLPYDLPENNTTEVTLEYGLALKDLPVSVGNNPTSIMLASRGNTTSHMRYTWLKTHSIDKYLPEISINIESANPKGTTSATTKTTDSKFGIMTLLSFLVFVIFCRIKERR